MLIPSAKTSTQVTDACPGTTPPAALPGARSPAEAQPPVEPPGQPAPELACEVLHVREAARTDWLALEPGGSYGVIGRPILDWALMVICLPLVGLLSLPLALINWFVQGSWSRVFFRQERVGRRGERFVLYKFRTMRDATGAEFEAWKAGDSGRVTPFGAFLRMSHLDELPQIINILRGEMTFIGPRPEMIETHRFACEAIPGFEQRLALRPGITGRAQIRNGYAGHCGDEYLRKFKEDEFYRTHYSLGADLAILLKTPIWMLTLKGWFHRRPAEDKTGDLALGAPDGTGVVLQPAPAISARAAGSSEPPAARPAEGLLPERDGTPSKRWAAL